MRAIPTSQSEARQGLATATQAASYLSLSRSTLWRLERQGTLTPVRIGRSLRFKWSDLLQMAGEWEGSAK